MEEEQKYSNRSGSRTGKKNAQQNTEAVSGNWTMPVLYYSLQLFSGKSADPGYYSGDRRRNDFLLQKEIVENYQFTKGIS